MPLFGKSPKTPQELVKIVRDALDIIEKCQEGKKAEKAQEEVSKNLVGMKNILYGAGDQEPQPELVSQLAQTMYESSLLLALIKNLAHLDFEAKKDVAQIYNNILRRQIGNRSPTVDHICRTEEILFTLCRGFLLACELQCLRHFKGTVKYENQQIALNCGIMLRDSIRYVDLAKIILNNKVFYSFFKYVEMSTFDIASDAFATFKELLTRHKILCAEFLEKEYDEVFSKYQKLLNSDNYVTKRQSLKLLGELLLDRHNFTIMTKYISNPDNLKLMMNMLRDRSRNIQFEAFHVFKVFVANPNKTPAILSILNKNKTKLVEFLSAFHTDRTEDEQFNDEKAYLIKQIGELQSSEPSSS